MEIVITIMVLFIVFGSIAFFIKTRPKKEKQSGTGGSISNPKWDDLQKPDDTHQVL